MPYCCQTQLPYEMSIAPFNNDTTGAVTSGNRVEQYLVVCVVLGRSLLAFYHFLSIIVVYILRSVASNYPFVIFILIGQDIIDPNMREWRYPCFQARYNLSLCKWFKKFLFQNIILNLFKELKIAQRKCMIKILIYEKNIGTFSGYSSFLHL